jgi:hypothetical protein
MTVTDEAKLFAIRQQLLEMRYKLDASINIINYVFERDDSGLEVPAYPEPCAIVHPSCSIELYPGQVAPPQDFTDVDPEELDVSLEEIVECVE